MSTRADLEINQGETYSISTTIEDDNDQIIDLTGYVGAAQMRKHYTSLTAYDFNVIISADQGLVTMSMSATQTNTIPSGRYVYDCEITDPDGKVTKILYGIVEVFPGVTR